MYYIIAFVAVAVLFVIFQPCVCAKERVIEKLEVASSAFKEGEMIPKKYSAYGENISPEISWPKPPIGTKCFALICEDPDAPIGIWTHWVVFNIPGKSRGLKESIPPHEALDDGTIQGLNDSKRIGYDGPRPPFGNHRYYFKVYALDTRLNLGARVTRDELLEAMKGNILAEGSVMGRYAK
ncbi:MAG: YbhB/YbcL family Raf kinase inhibitor-like protein [Candidatus Omnitrophica bacterium]|nr:YbhB/YbcL family Raf kinase inhibitor-like protein [Candidatus Omnitrophota bacterium]